MFLGVALLVLLLSIPFVTVIMGTVYSMALWGRDVRLNSDQNSAMARWFFSGVAMIGFAVFCYTVLPDVAVVVRILEVLGIVGYCTICAVFPYWPREALREAGYLTPKVDRMAIGSVFVFLILFASAFGIALS